MEFITRKPTRRLALSSSLNILSPDGSVFRRIQPIHETQGTNEETKPSLIQTSVETY